MLMYLLWPCFTLSTDQEPCRWHRRKPAACHDVAEGFSGSRHRRCCHPFHHPAGHVANASTDGRGCEAAWSVCVFVYMVMVDFVVPRLSRGVPIAICCSILHRIHSNAGSAGHFVEAQTICLVRKLGSPAVEVVVVLVHHIAVHGPL